MYSPSSSQILIVTRSGSILRTVSRANPSKRQIKDSHGSAMSSLMSGTTSSSIERLRRVSTSVKLSLVPGVKMKSLPREAASNSSKCSS